MAWFTNELPGCRLDLCQSFHYSSLRSILCDRLHDNYPVTNHQPIGRIYVIVYMRFTKSLIMDYRWDSCQSWHENYKLTKYGPIGWIYVIVT